MNILSANSYSPTRYQQPVAAQPKAASGPLSAVGDFFERSNNRDLGELGIGFIFAGGGAVAGGLVGAIAGTTIGSLSGSPIAGMAAGVGVGGIAGAVSGWFASTPSKKAFA